jgi:hypothetical protein
VGMLPRERSCTLPDWNDIGLAVGAASGLGAAARSSTARRRELAASDPLAVDLNMWSGMEMATPDEQEPRRAALQRAVYSRLNSHKETAGKFLFTDAWLIAGHAVDAMLEVENATSTPRSTDSER